MIETPTTIREFRKHRILGDIYACELLFVEGQYELVAAVRCTRPEELTRGALPVLPLYNDEAMAFVNRSVQEFVLWEPPMRDEEAFAAIVAAEKKCQETEGDLGRAHKAHASAKKLHDQACDDLRRAVREASEPADPPAPLIAIAEAGDSQAQHFDADMERFDDDDDRNRSAGNTDPELRD